MAKLANSDEPPGGRGLQARERDRPALPGTVVQLVEALLFMGGVPLTPERAGAVIRGLEPTAFQEAIGLLARDYRRQGRPYLVQIQEDGYVLRLRPQWKW